MGFEGHILLGIKKRNALKIIKLNSKINESDLTLNQLNKENLYLKNTIKERNLLISKFDFCSIGFPDNPPFWCR